MKIEQSRKNQDSVHYNAEIVKRLPTNHLVWRDFEHKRFAVIDGHISDVSRDRLNDKITDVTVSDIVVVIADPKMYDEVGQQRGGGIWPVEDVELVSKNEAGKLRKNGLLH